MNKPRPILHLQAAQLRYPRLWRLTERLHAEPLLVRDRALVYVEAQQLVAAWANGDLEPNLTDGERDMDTRAEYQYQVETARMAAVSAWRATKGIYRFHPTAFDHLAGTPLDGRIPIELLTRLPEWCPYIEYPASHPDLYGTYVYLDWMPALDTIALHVMLDAKHGQPDGEATPLEAWHALKHLLVPLFDGRYTIDQAINFMSNDARRLDPTVVVRPASQKTMSHYLKEAVNAVLYLGSRNADIVAADGTDDGAAFAAWRPRGQRMPKAPRRWNTAWRIGAKLRAGAPARPEERTGNRRAAPRPHIRRAHWHTFWTGPRNDPAARTPVVKWVAPTTVGGDGIVATVRDVGVA